MKASPNYPNLTKCPLGKLICWQECPYIKALQPNEFDSVRYCDYPFIKNKAHYPEKLIKE